ncbi:MAG: MmcQ/YjbR family DNA-binding protein [Mycoplasmatales bacterium]
MVHFEKIEQYLMKLTYVTLDFPFDETTRVYKVAGKMVAIIGSEKTSISLKNHPDENQALRLMFEGIIPGYHLNKEHWNTVMFDSDVPTELFFELIDKSYEIIYAKLTKKEKAKLIERKK